MKHWTPILFCLFASYAQGADVIYHTSGQFRYVPIVPNAKSIRTPNFEVFAADASLAKQIGEVAEKARKEVAVAWLGQELASWGRPCAIRVHPKPSGQGGSTTFAFGNGGVLTQHMQVEGVPERLLGGVVPHEVTHTIMAAYFKRQAPRWADEGAAMLSEDQQEHSRYERNCEAALQSQRSFPLRRLFAFQEYPADAGTFYAQSFSITRYLVQAKGRTAFLAFVTQGMSTGWDRAVHATYGQDTIEELQVAWQADCWPRLFQKQPRPQPPPPPRLPDQPPVPPVKPDATVPPVAPEPLRTPATPPVDLGPLQKDIAALKAQIGAMQGKDGAAGKDGAPGRDADPQALIDIRAQLADLQTQFSRLAKPVPTQPGQLPQRIRIVPAQ